MDWYKCTLQWIEVSSEHIVFSIIWASPNSSAYLCTLYLCICLLSRGVCYTVQHIVCGLICVICPPAYFLFFCAFCSNLVNMYICVVVQFCTLIFIFVQHIVWPDLLILICTHLATGIFACLCIFQWISLYVYSCICVFLLLYICICATYCVAWFA